MKCQICDTDNTKKECLHYNKVMNTTENNKLIAEFMQLVECETDYLYHPSSEKGFLKDYLMYNSDWNWLMEVVEKIEDLNYSIEINKQEENDYQCLVVKKDILIQEFSNTKMRKINKLCI